MAPLGLEQELSPQPGESFSGTTHEFSHFPPAYTCPENPLFILGFVVVLCFCVCVGEGGSRINFMASQVLNFESNRVKMLENLIPLVDKIQNYLHI